MDNPCIVQQRYRLPGVFPHTKMTLLLYGRRDVYDINELDITVIPIKCFILVRLLSLFLRII